MSLVKLEGVAPGGSVGKLNLVLDTTGYQANLHRPHIQPTELSPDVQVALLSDNQQVTIRRVVRRLLVHALASGIDQHSKTLFLRWVASAGDQPHSGDKIQVLGAVVVEGIPSQLIRDVVQLGDVGALGDRAVHAR